MQLNRKDKLKINTVCSQNNVRILVLTKEQLNWESIKALL